MAMDSRIKQFQTEEKANKNRKRLEREAAEKKAKEEAIQAQEEEKKRQEAAEVAAKAAKVDEKKAKDAAKNAAKKNKRVLRNSVKDVNYFVEGEPSPAQIDGVLGDVDALIPKLEPEELASLADKLAPLKGKEAVKGAWTEVAQRLVKDGSLKEGDAKYLV
jgi:DnaJ family protein C protein 2